MSAFRKLNSFDTPALIRHWCALDANERMDRFHGTMSDAAIIRLAESLDWSHMTLVGYFDHGELRGVAMVAFDKPKDPGAAPDCAELALDVQGAWQGKGLGSQLGDRAVTVAQNRGCAKLLILTTPQNRRMRQIGARMGGTAKLEDGLVVVTLDLAGATPFSHWLEAAQQATGTIIDLSERLSPPMWPDMHWSDVNWTEVKWPEVKWPEVKWSDLFWRAA